MRVALTASLMVCGVLPVAPRAFAQGVGDRFPDVTRVEADYADEAERFTALEHL